GSEVSLPTLGSRPSADLPVEFVYRSCQGRANAFLGHLEIRRKRVSLLRSPMKLRFKPRLGRIVIRGFQRELAREGSRLGEHFREPLRLPLASPRGQPGGGRLEFDGIGDFLAK